MYALIYGITKRFVLSYSISLTITLLFVIVSYIYMLKAYKFNNNTILLSVILLLSFGGSTKPDRFFAILNFLMYGYYSFYTITVFITIGIVQRVYNKNRVKKTYMFFLYLISFVSGISGIRMLLFLYIPLLVVMFLSKCIKKEKVFTSVMFITVMNIIGIIVGKIFFYSTVAYQTEPVKISKFEDIGSKLWDNMISVIYMF